MAAIYNKVNFLTRYHIDWLKWLLILVAVGFSTLLLVVPILAILFTAFSEGWHLVWRNLHDADLLHALGLTLLITAITVPVNLLFGLALAWLIARFNFPGRQLLLSLIDIPFAVSPVVAGLLFLFTYGPSGLAGSWLADINWQVMFAWPGLTLVTIFVTAPFIVRELLPVMLNQGSQEEEAAVLLGASGWQLFWRVTLPNIRWALLYGVILTNARAIGEFGAVSVVSGSIRGQTYTLPLQVELLYQDYNTIGAFTAALLLTLLAVISLLLKRGIEWRITRQRNLVSNGVSYGN